jgi:hypothetical protein
VAATAAAAAAATAALCPDWINSEKERHRPNDGQSKDPSKSLLHDAPP